MHEFDEMAYSGVTFFFMLSGFLVTSRDTTIKSAKNFYRKRLRRIFPLHWLTLALMIALDVAIMHKFHYGWDLPLHVALLQSWIPDHNVFYNYSIHSWFLSSLLACIIATPLLLRCLERMSRKASCALLVAACCAVAVAWIVSSGQWRSYLHVCPFTRVVDYSIGLLLGTILPMSRKTHGFTTLRATLLELGSIAILAAFIALNVSGNTVATKLEQQALWWIPTALIIVCSHALRGNEGWVGKLLCSKPLQWLGEISFEIYILQKLANNVFCYLVAPFFGHYGILIYDHSFVGTMPLLIVAAWLVHKFFNVTPKSKLKA